MTTDLLWRSVPTSPPNDLTAFGPPPRLPYNVAARIAAVRCQRFIHGRGCVNGVRERPNFREFRGDISRSSDPYQIVCGTYSSFRSHDGAGVDSDTVRKLQIGRD